jgi:hypothetical protein
MESVYGAGTFSNFSTFLTTFRSSGTPSYRYDDKLRMVGSEISKIVEPCASVDCAIKTNRLRSILPSQATLPQRTTQAPALLLTSLEGQPPPEAEQGGPSQSKCLIM